MKTLKAVAPFVVSAFLLKKRNAVGETFFVGKVKTSLKALTATATTGESVKINEEVIEPAADLFWEKAKAANAWADANTRLMVTVLGFYLLIPDHASYLWIGGLVCLVGLVAWPSILEKLVPPESVSRIRGRDISRVTLINAGLILVGFGVAFVTTL